MPTDVPTKNAIDVPGQWISDTEMTCMSPNFDFFGPKEAVVQILIQGGDLTTTSVPFNFFRNTRANKSLCHGPGLLHAQAVNVPSHFLIQTRNDLGENRQSGRDEFEVKVKCCGENPQIIDAEIIDTDNGTYEVIYTAPHACDVQIDVMFKDDKGKMVPIRGSPYTASFSDDTHKNFNDLTGEGLKKHMVSL